ncbi:hydroxymethylbilane synthase [Paenibacillus sp. MBLB4367]|uniref:hydroxymethylbilane synthase n=1 Tax=Paenibacillus sp. MBLB4367 TaxID=3384767 RepID=UPI0039080699
MRTIVVGTRQSALALTQTNQVIEQLKDICKRDGIECEFAVRKIVTKGDQILDVTLSKVGGKGLFVKEIEQALLDGEIDMAVHSMKDMPAELPDGLVIGAVPKREDPRDCLISRQGYLTLDELPVGAKVGTSSLRRASQLKHHRPDLQIESIRGNIDTRIRKLEEEGFDAILLAAAGLHRMGWKDRITAYLPADLCIPAVGQGALGIECRGDDTFMLELLGKFTDDETARCVEAERSYLRTLQGGCQVPIGAYARLEPAQEGESSARLLTLTGIVGSAVSGELLRETVSGSDPERLGDKLAQFMIMRGADRMLAEATAQS